MARSQNRKPRREVAVGLHDYLEDIESIVDDVCNVTSDMHEVFRPLMADTLIYMAMFDSKYHEDDFWDKIIDFVTDRVYGLFESYTVFMVNTYELGNLTLTPNDIDIEEGSDIDDLTVEDIVGEEVDDRVDYIREGLPEGSNWADEREMAIAASEWGSIITEMFAEYDVTDDEDYDELAYDLRRAVLRDELSPDQIEDVCIDKRRKKLKVVVSLGKCVSDNDDVLDVLDVVKLDSIEDLGGDDDNSIRNGSRRRSAA